MGFLLRYGSKDLQEGSLHGRIATIFLSQEQEGYKAVRKTNHYIYT